MKRIYKFGLPKWIMLLAALACAGTWAASQVRSVRDRSEVAKMTEKMKTICVGRFLVDVPAQAVVNLAQEIIAGFEIDTLEESEAIFRDRVAAREAEIETRGADPRSGDEGGMVEARDLRVSGMTGRVFVYGYDRGYYMDGSRVDIESVSVQAHAHVAGLSFTLSAKSTNEASAKQAEALLVQLRVRGQDEISTVPGFCTWRAVFTEPLPPHNNESITMFLGLSGHHDVALALFSIANAHPDPGLLARMSDVNAAASADEMLRVTKLRSRKRTIDGMAGEEHAERVHEFNFTTGYTFNWEAKAAQGNLLQPYLSLELQTGASERPGGPPVDSSLDQDAALALWDRIASTLRPHKPNAPPST